MAVSIAVFGAASDKINKEFLDAGYRLGELFAKNDIRLVFGGGATGMMGAVARGSHDAGGRQIGIAPRFFDTPGILFKESTEFIYTENMRERKAILDDIPDAFIIVPGGIGTYDEFFEILTLKQLERTDKPILLLNTNGYFSELFGVIKKAVDEGFTEHNVFGLFSLVATPEEAISKLKEVKLI